MVARKSDAETQQTTLVSRLFDAWRRALTRLFALGTRKGVPAENPARGIRPHRVPLPAVIGATSVCVGAVLSVVMASGRTGMLEAASAGSAAVLWAAGRWWLMRRRAGEARAEAVDRAAAWGLVPWVLGMSPGLRVAAWATSAVLTWFLLERDGVSRADSLDLVGRAWGAHAAFAVAVTVLSNLAVGIIGG